MDIVHTIFERALFVIPLWFSLGVHEWAHARAAYALGDDTAEKLGRMTLDPLAHLHPIGTVLLPLLGIPFGWAKPVPVQPMRFHSSVSMTGGMLMVAAAGPLSNVAIAIVLLVGDLIAEHFAPGALSSRPLLESTFEFAFTANVAMAIFNLLPFAPLDGSRIVEGLIPFERRALWDRIGMPIGVLCLVVFFMFLGPVVRETISSVLTSARAWASPS